MPRLNPDFTVQNEGTMLLLQLNTRAARSWAENNIGQHNGFQPYWPIVVIEHRYIRDIVNGIQADGLTLV